MSSATVGGNFSLGRCSHGFQTERGEPARGEARARGEAVRREPVGVARVSTRGFFSVRRTATERVEPKSRACETQSLSSLDRHRPGGRLSSFLRFEGNRGPRVTETAPDHDLQLSHTLKPAVVTQFESIESSNGGVAHFSGVIDQSSVRNAVADKTLLSRPSMRKIVVQNCPTIVAGLFFFQNARAGPTVVWVAAHVRYVRSVTG